MVTSSKSESSRWVRIRRIWVLVLALWCIGLGWFYARGDILARLDPGQLDLRLRLSATDAGLATVSASATGAAREYLPRSGQPERPTSSGARPIVLSEAGGGPKQAARVEYAVQLARAESMSASRPNWDAPRLVPAAAVFPFADGPRRVFELSASIELPEGLSAIWIDDDGLRGPRLGSPEPWSLSIPDVDQLLRGTLVVGSSWRRAPEVAGEDLIVAAAGGSADGLLAAALEWRRELDELLPCSDREHLLVVLEDPPEGPAAPKLRSRRHSVVPVAGTGGAARERFLEELCLARLAAAPALPAALAWLDPALARRIALALGPAGTEPRRWREILSYMVFLAPSREAPLDAFAGSEGRAYEYLGSVKGPLFLHALEAAAEGDRSPRELAAAWLDVRAAVVAGGTVRAALARSFGSAASDAFERFGGGERPLDLCRIGDEFVLRPEPSTGLSATSRMTLALTADTETFLETCGCRLRQAGGIARRARVIGRAAENGPVLAMDLGNVLPRLTPTEVDEVVLGEIRTQLKAHELMGYALQVVGPNELYAGLERLAEVSPSSAAPSFRASNVRLLSGAEPPWSREPLRMELAGRSVRIVPIAPTSPYWIAPSELQRRTAAIEIEDPIETARRLCADAGEDELIVVAGSLPTWRIPELLRAAPEIDLVVSSDRWTLAGSAGRKRADSPWFLASGYSGDTLVVLANGESHGVTLVRLEVGKGGRIASFEQEETLLAPELEEDLAVRALLDDFYAGLEPKGFDPARASPLAVLDLERNLLAKGEAAHGEYVGSAACRECHAEAYARWKTTPHAHAYRTLEEKQRSRSAACVRCHVVGYGLPGGFSLAETRASAELRGVGCEVCHGPGREHAIERPGDPTAIRKTFAQADCELCHDAKHSEPLSGRSVDPFDLGAHRIEALLDAPRYSGGER